jgi:hypothetical protein
MMTDAGVLATGARILVTRAVRGHTGLLCAGGSRRRRRGRAAPADADERPSMVIILCNTNNLNNHEFYTATIFFPIL